MKKQVRYFYCENCGDVWEDDTFIHDVKCPHCLNSFADELIEIIDEEEYKLLNGEE